MTRALLRVIPLAAGLVAIHWAAEWWLRAGDPGGWRTWVGVSVAAAFGALLGKATQAIDTASDWARGRWLETRARLRELDEYGPLGEGLMTHRRDGAEKGQP